MVSIKMNHKSVVWPIDALYDSKKNFIGFIMESIHGMELFKFCNPILSENFNIHQLSRAEVIKIVISILDTMNYLHKRNVILGDIKLENFMIKNNDYTNVFLSIVIVTKSGNSQQQSIQMDTLRQKLLGLAQQHNIEHSVMSFMLFLHFY